MTERGLVGSQKGFSIVTALFILLVLAVLGGFMVTMSGVQSRTSLWALQGARAYHAARSGLEWGVYKSLSTGACAADAFAVDGFSVNVTCSEESFTEGGEGYKVYSLTSLAQSGIYGSSDYISRQLRGRVTGAQP
jgi:MSHA biogenesis protein MshP